MNQKNMQASLMLNKWMQYAPIHPFMKTQGITSNRGKYC
jgi:hypothetical protein